MAGADQKVSGITPVRGRWGGVPLRIEPFREPREFTPIPGGTSVMVHGRKASPTAVAGGPEAVEEGELALLQRVAAGDRAAFESLYRCYFPRLTRFLGRVLQRPHTVEEVLNDAMLVVWRKAASFNGQSRISTWIFAIAYRRALKAIKR